MQTHELNRSQFLFCQLKPNFRRFRCLWRRLSRKHPGAYTCYFVTLLLGFLGLRKLLGLNPRCPFVCPQLVDVCCDQRGYPSSRQQFRHHHRKSLPILQAALPLSLEEQSKPR